MTAGLQVRCDALAGAMRVCVELSLDQPWTVLFGASGSGKTSLLRLMAGLWRPADSTVVVGGRVVSALPPHRRGIVLVAQHPALFPHRTVRGNVAFGAADDAMVDDMLRRFGLESLATRAVRFLSGGEAQRVCLARALAVQPALLLLDESFTGLHRTLRDELLVVVRDVQRERGMQVVSVTHDVGEAFACADEVVRLDAGWAVARGAAATVLAAERDDLLQRLGTRAGAEL